MAKLFLSYAREDAAVAERLARGLERRGRHDVWWDRDLLGGASFGPEIEQQLRDCDVVIAIWSRASVQSPWVRDEAAIGRDAQKLVPVTLGEIDPPIGFRQFHTIDIGQKGRASASALEKLERAVEHVARKEGSAPKQPPPGLKARPGHPSWTSIAIASGAALLLAALVGTYLWRGQHPASMTVAIVPAAGQPPAAADYANAIAADIAAFLSAQGSSASVLDSNDPKAGNATYRFTVGYSPQGQKADTSLAMAASGQQGIVWSQNWSGIDPAATDLKKQMSFGVARALLCAIEARRSGTSLGAALLKLYIVACSGLHGGGVAYEQLATGFSQVASERPDFSPAWQNLAIVRSLIFRDDFDDQGVPSPRLNELTAQAISRGRALNPKSGKLVLAEANLANGDWRKQLPLLDKAIALEPNEADSYVARSYELQDVGRMREAIADAEKAVALDPLSPGAEVSYIDALMYAGRLSVAKDEIGKAQKIWPDDSDLQAADLGYSMRYGDPKHGEDLVSRGLKSLTDEETRPPRRVLAAREDPTPANVDAAVDIWRRAMNLHPSATTHYLLTLGTFGKFEEAFRVANDPKLRPFIIPQSFFRPEFAPMRRDRRFIPLAAQYGLVTYWKSSGKWPDFCSDEPLEYDCKTEAAKYG